MGTQRERGEGAGGGALCDEARIGAAFAGKRGRLEREHGVRGGAGEVPSLIKTILMFMRDINMVNGDYAD